MAEWNGVNVFIPGTMKLDASEKILITATENAAYSEVIRFNANGNVDTGFGTSGAVRIDASMWPSEDIRQPVVRGLSIDNDGKIIALGGGMKNVTFEGYAVGVRLTSAGVLDTASAWGDVGTPGKIIFYTGHPFEDRLNGAIQDLNGNLFSFGYYVDPTENFHAKNMIFRLSSGGALESSSGKTFDLGRTNVSHMPLAGAMQSTGKFVLVGTMSDDGTGTDSSYDAFVMRIVP